MKTQLSEFKKIIFILSIRKLDLIKILVLILIASSELLGLSIVIPFISNTFNLSDKEYFNFLNQGDLTTYEIQSILLGILLFVFFFKAIISIFIVVRGVFSLDRTRYFKKKLILYTKIWIMKIMLKKIIQSMLEILNSKRLFIKS